MPKNAAAAEADKAAAERRSPQKRAFAFGIEKAAAQRQKATRPPQTVMLYTAKKF